MKNWGMLKEWWEVACCCYCSDLVLISLWDILAAASDSTLVLRPFLYKQEGLIYIHMLCIQLCTGKSPRLSCGWAVVTAAGARPQRVTARPARAAQGHGHGSWPETAPSLGSYQKALNQQERGVLTSSAKVFMASGALLSNTWKEK